MSIRRGILVTILLIIGISLFYPIHPVEVTKERYVQTTTTITPSYFSYLGSWQVKVTDQVQLESDIKLPKEAVYKYPLEEVSIKISVVSDLPVYVVTPSHTYLVNKDVITERVHISDFWVWTSTDERTYHYGITVINPLKTVPTTVSINAIAEFPVGGVLSTWNLESVTQTEMPSEVSLEPFIPATVKTEIIFGLAIVSLISAGLIALGRSPFSSPNKTRRDQMEYRCKEVN